MAPRHHTQKRDGSQRAQPSANARGYAKRRERKAGQQTASFDDAYEFASESQPRNRRAGVALDLGRDDQARGAADGDSDSDGSAVGMDEELRIRIARRMQEDTVLSADDEEVDSDDAFDDEDEERFGSYAFAQKKNGTVAQKPQSKVNLAESDEDGEAQEDSDEEDLEEETYDPLAMLDGRKSVAAGDEDEDMDSENADDSDEDGSEDSDEPKLVSDDDAAMDEDALDSLAQFVGTLEHSGVKRKAPDDADLDADRTMPPPPKRRLLKERTEAGAEGEFAVRSSDNTMLKLDDLLAPLSAATATTLKASTKALKNAGSKSGALPAPLPLRTQERLDRAAAYEQTKEEVDKWKVTMKRIKEAEHLSFPLQPPETTGTSTLELAAKFKPSNELETAVDKLLRTAGLRDQDLEKTEALQTNHLSVEEVAERRAELLRTRELMFRADAKAKRVAKIKSKAFRRIRKKQREKDAAINGLGAAGDDELDDEDERMHLEVARARERATLRHKNTGKWAKAMQNRGDLDVDQRRDINEMLAKGERLRRRIQGVGSGEDDESGESDDDSDADIETIKRAAFDELAQLDGDVGEPSGQLKGVYQMKFMRDGMARQQKEADDLANALRADLQKVNSDSEDDEMATPPATNGGVVSDRINGRMVFAPGNPLTRQSTQASNVALSDISSITPQSLDGAAPPTLTSSPGAEPPSAASNNPWLNGSADGPSGRVSRKKNEVIVAKGSNTADRAAHTLSKKADQASRNGNAKAIEDESTVDIDVDDVLKLQPAALPRPIDEDDSDKNSEQDEQERLEAQKNGKRTGTKDLKGTAKAPAAFQQRELVALAFAGDNVVEDFAELKRQEMEADAPQVEDLTLAGWGSWGGKGAKKQKSKPHLLKTIPGIDPTQRKDYGKAHVIISEKKDKKAQKYLTKDLPFPYTGRAQFERSLEAPLGAEWNTRVGFQRGTLPRVVKKMGTVIAPVRKNL
ncbi:Utp14-domain-containing protein [Auriculariales sp. MPI-PUGE-AT-0066]|nr:Utp14-domain-containing protein [Auriculariales sp. MPI-PUGE-AT-0066]